LRITHSILISDDGTLQRWDIASGAVPGLETPRRHTGLDPRGFSSNGSRLATGDSDKGIRALEHGRLYADSPRCSRLAMRSLRLPSPGWQCLGFVQSRSDHPLLAGRGWTLTQHVRGIRRGNRSHFQPGWQAVVSSSQDKTIRVWPKTLAPASRGFKIRKIPD